MRSVIWHLCKPGREHFPLSELLFHMKDVSLEMACAVAMWELEMKKFWWTILEAWMKNLTFPTIHLMPCHAQGGRTTKGLQEIMLESWMFENKLDPGTQFLIVLQLTGNARMTSEWWWDCEVEESPGQVRAWQKQFVANLINNKDLLGFTLPEFSMATGCTGTAARLSS
jgi:hypothetical protein